MLPGARKAHARAITSRTDREFGLSMLRRFHEEIERRVPEIAELLELPEGTARSRLARALDDLRAMPEVQR